MRIERVTRHGWSLDEEYQRLSEHADAHWSEYAQAMMRLLAFLRDSKGPDVWAKTSHHALELLPTDDESSPVLVRIRMVNLDLAPLQSGETYVKGYNISYRLPDAEAPWSDAWIHGTTPDVAVAASMVLIGIQRTSRLESGL